MRKFSIEFDFCISKYNKMFLSIHDHKWGAHVGGILHTLHLHIPLKIKIGGDSR